MKVNNLSIKKRLIPYLQLRSHWEQKYIKQLVKSFFRHKKNNAVIIIDAIKCLTSFKWVKKCFRRIKEGWKEEAVKGFAAFTVHSISNKILCCIRNKDGARIKIKDNVFLLKTYLTQIKRKLLVMKAPSQCNWRTITWYGKSRSSSLSDKKILIEEMLENYMITNLPNRIIEMILVDAVKFFKNLTETYFIWSTWLVINRGKWMKKPLRLRRKKINFIG